MSLLVAKHINAKLSSSKELKKIVKDRMFPVAVTKETEFPFVVYERDGVSPERTKDYIVGDTVQESVYVFASSYLEAVKIADMIRKSLDNSIGDYGEFEVTECEMIGSEEAYSENTFLQKLVFSIKTE